MKKVLLSCLLASSLFADSICDIYFDKVNIQIEKIGLYLDDKDIDGSDRAYYLLQYYLNEGIPNCDGPKKTYLLKIKNELKGWK